MDTNMVREFHKKHDFPLDRRIETPVAVESLLLQRVEREVHALSEATLDPNDLALYRLHLILEETAELAKGLIMGSRVKTADAIADLLYVVIGTAETYGLPWTKLLEEVHRSNMTKKIRDPSNLRMRDKGPDYRPPDIEGILRAAIVDDRNGGGAR